MSTSQDRIFERFQLESFCSPEEFEKRTLTRKDRMLFGRGQADSWKKVSQAHAEIYKQRLIGKVIPDEKLRDYHDALAAYVSEPGHGAGYWEKSERNRASEGYLRRSFEWTSMRLARSSDAKRAEAAIDRSLPMKRWEVLYFLSKVEIEADGGVSLTSGLKDTYQKVRGSARSSSSGGDWIELADLSTIRDDDAMASVAAEDQRSGETFLQAARGIKDAGLAVLRKLWANIVKYVEAAIESIARGMGCDTSTGVGSFVNVALFIVKQALKRADVGQLADGIGVVDFAKGLGGICESVAKKIVLEWQIQRSNEFRAGHPQLILESIRGVVNRGIVSAIGDAAIAAGKVAVAAFSGGILGHVYALVTAVLGWIASKIWVRHVVAKIREFQGTARDLFNRLKNSMDYTDPDGNGKLRVTGFKDGEKDTICHDQTKFAEFFREGCKASPLVPIAVLLSGLGGDWMTWTKLTTDVGVTSPDMFARDTELLDHLKNIGVSYYRESGVKVSTSDPAFAYTCSRMNGGTYIGCTAAQFETARKVETAKEVYRSAKDALTSVRNSVVAASG